MEITYKQLEELTQTPKARPRPATRERRRDPRFPLRTRGTLVCACNNQLSAPCSVRMREVSPRGASFLHCRGMRIGDTFFLRLPRQNARPAWLHCRVARSTRVETDLYVIGSALVGVLNIDRRRDVA